MGIHLQRPASAQTPAADAPHAGVLLRTQAEVTLLQPGQTQEVRLYSNVVEVRVTPWKRCC